MSRQGNYVTVPNTGGSNAMSGLSGTLADVSKIFLAKEKQEQDQAQWEAEEARRVQDHNYKLEGQEARRLFAESLADMGNREYKLSDHSADIQDHYNRLRGSIAAEQDSLRQYLTDPNASIDGHMKLFKQKLKDSGLGQGAIDDLVFERTRRADALRRELGGYEGDEQRSARLDEALGALYNPDLQRIDKEIKAGTALVQRERLAAVARGLDPRIVQHMSQEEIYQALTPNIGGETLASLRTRDAQRVKDLNKSYSDNQSAAIQAHNAQVRRYSSGSGSSRTGKGVKDNYEKALELISDVNFDIGMFDNDDKIPALNALVSMPGVDAESAALALRLGVEKQWFGLDKKLPEVESDAFIKVQQLAEDLAARRRGVRSSSVSGSGGGSYGVRFKDGQFDYSPAVQKSDVELKRDLLNFDGAKTRYLNPREQFLASSTITRPQVVQTASGPKVVQAPVAAAVQGNGGTVTPTTPTTPDSLPTAPVKSLETHGIPYRKGPAKTDAVRNLPLVPENMQQVMQVLDARTARDREARADRVRADREAVLAYNKNFPDGDGITTDTMFVHRFDDKGESRPWAEVVRDVNKQFEAQGWGGGWFDKISADEFEVAKGNPAMQQEIVDRTNRLLANNYKFQLPQVRGMEHVGNALGGTFDAVGGWFSDNFGGVDPTSPEYRDKVLSRQNEETTYNNRLQATRDLEQFINRDRNLEGAGLADIPSIALDFAADSNADDVALMVAAPGGVGYGLQGAKAGVQGTKALLRRLPKKSASKPKPKARPKQEQPPKKSEAQLRRERDAQRKEMEQANRAERKANRDQLTPRERQRRIDDRKARKQRYAEYRKELHRDNAPRREAHAQATAQRVAQKEAAQRARELQNKLKRQESGQSLDKINPNISRYLEKVAARANQ